MIGFKVYTQRVERAGEFGRAEEDGGMACMETSGQYELTDVDQNHRPEISFILSSAT